jgi:energy-coupling factor transporter transmembrane protein EcfT
MIRGQNALSNNLTVKHFKKIQIFAINIPDFILVNLWRTEKLSKSMKMRGYGIKFPMSSYPYISFNIHDLKIFSFTIVFIFGIHIVL